MDASRWGQNWAGEDGDEPVELQVIVLTGALGAAWESDLACDTELAEASASLDDKAGRGSRAVILSDTPTAELGCVAATETTAPASAKRNEERMIV